MAFSERSEDSAVGDRFVSSNNSVAPRKFILPKKTKQKGTIKCLCGKNVLKQRKDGFESYGLCTYVKDDF